MDLTLITDKSVAFNETIKTTATDFFFPSFKLYCSSATHDYTPKRVEVWLSPVGRIYEY